MSTDDNLFPKHWGLQDVDSGLQGNDFPDMPDFPDPMAESGAAVNYLSPFVRDFEFTNIVSWEIAGNYFYNLPQQPIGKKIEWVKEPECKTEIEPQTLWIYRERSGEKGYQAGKDELLYIIKIFISTNNAKLKKLYEFMQDGVADDEILFFMEDNTDDLSDQSLYVRFGKKVDKDFLLQMSDKNLDFIVQNMPDFDRNKLRELISTGEVKAPITPLRGLLFMALNISTITGVAGKALGWLSEQLGEAVEQLMIPESIWDTKSEDYFLKQENVTDAMQLDTSFFKQWQQSMEQSPQWQVLSAVSPVAGRMPQILDVVQNMAAWYNAEVAAVVNLIYRRYEQGVEQLDEVLYLSEQIAFLCGLWNGLVDFVAGIFKFLGALLQAQYDIAQNFQGVLEAIDDFREAWAAFSFADFFETAWQLQQDMLVELLLFFTDPNPRENYNFDRIAYAGGFGVGFIASFFIPAVNVAKVSAIAKYSKFIPEEFISSLNLAKVRELKGSKALIKWLEEVSALLGKKGEEMYQELRKLLDKIFEWIKTNKKRFEKTKIVRGISTTNNYLRRYIGKDIQPLVKQSKAYSLYGRAGRNVVKLVDEEATKLVKASTSNNELRTKVMVNGMIYKKGGKVSKVHTRTNFLKEEIGKLDSKSGKYFNELGETSEYQKFLDDMHPTLRNRYEIHLEEMAKGLNASVEDVARAGKPASHGEIRALDALLKDIDPNAKLGDDIFKNILGYNRYLIKKGVQPPCVHCFYLTDFVTYIGL